ncbi:MAG: acetyl-CoA carboxylase biotin carboxyl carrier protein [Planctomycetes bacterium]|nr:acetyl-CoA carboxylase biotin carboxyl carrier protein [Planctomycetota bacterium]
MMDIRKLKELVRLMVENDLTELDLRDKEEQATIRRQTTLSAPQLIHHGSSAQSTPQVPALATGSAGATAVGRPSPDGSEGQGDTGLEAIESPMVGTFYAASGPDKPPLVAVGTVVEPNTVVCLLEAMKIFNEIKAERAGTIAKVLVKNGQAVEFGQQLFLIRPS